MKPLITVYRLLITLSLFLLPFAFAQAQTSPTQQILLTTSTNAVGANTTAAVTSAAFSPNSLTGFTVIPGFALSGTGTANVTFNFQASLDGTNWTTVAPFSYTVAATGTTPVTGYCSFPIQSSGTGVSNIPYVRLASVTNVNTPSTLTINSITISKSNR